MSEKQTYFRNEWLLDTEFKEWIKEVKGDRTIAKCKLCRIESNLSSMGNAALKSHIKYQKHVELVKIKKSSGEFFKKASSDHHTEKKEMLKLIQIYHHFLLKKMSQKQK